MLDLNMVVKQEQEISINKLVLLKQIKIALESIMFDNQSFTARASWQNFSGTMTIFARHILSVLENRIAVLELPRSASSSVSCSPNELRIDLKQHSRTSTNTTLNAENALWLFITSNLHADTVSSVQDQDPRDVTASVIEKTAHQNFMSFYNQLEQVTTTQSTIDTKQVRKLSTLSSRSTRCISDQCNLPLEWITYSLRQNILLNQLVYLLSNETQIQDFYQPGAFLMDRTYVEDFLNYMRAYELRDYSILSKVKRNFFEIQASPSSSSHPMRNRSQNNSQSGDSHRSSSATSPPSNIPIFSLPHTTTKARNLPSRSPSSSRNSSVTTNGVCSGSFSNVPEQQSDLYTDSLIEQAIKEVNNLTLKRHAASKSHRRMDSFPNVQINVAKRNNMAAMSASTANSSLNCDLPVSASESLNKIESQSDQNGSVEPIVLLRPTSPIRISNHPRSFTEPDYDCTDPSPGSHDIYQKTSVFDFIHSQQINLECSQLDKENSHFIIADISIAAFELIKTQELAETMDTTTTLNNTPVVESPASKLPMPFVTKTRASSSGIQITNPNNHLRIKKPYIDSPSQLASPNLTRSYLDDFGATSMACSMERELIYTSGFASPNPEIHSVCSSVASKYTPPPAVAVARKFSQSVHSLDSLSPSNVMNTGEDVGELNSKLGIIMSNSSSDLQTVDTGTSNRERSESTSTAVDETEAEEMLVVDNKERITKMREKWLIAARKIVITQTLAKTERSRTVVDTEASAPTSFLFTEPPSEDRNSIESGLIGSYSSMLPNKRNSIGGNRTRRFSWEEIINLDTAEHISTRLIERMVDLKTDLVNKRANKIQQQQNRFKVTVPNLRQLESVIQNLEYYEYMQIYFELRSNGLLEKYLVDILNKRSSTGNKQNPNLLKSRVPNTIAKVKAAAVAAAAAISLNEEERQEDAKSETMTERSFENTSSTETEKNILIRQISSNMSGLQNPNFNLLKSTVNLRGSKRQDSLASVSSIQKFTQARIIGDENWAPVRDQLILNQTPKQKRLDQMVQQNFRCADCGIQVRRDKIKSFNYCEYYCKYFCRCCHINNHSYIPSQVIYSSDFRTKYEVSKKAKNFLEKIYNEPVITLESLNPQLFDRTSVLTKLKRLRLRLYNCRGYINSCRFATELKKQLYNQFDDFIINDQHVYSIETLFKIKKTRYYEDLKSIVNQIMDHIKKCEICSQQGYICGLCTNNELLYPFDLEKVEKCANCLTCYHKSCFKRPEQCPRCRRKRTRVFSNSSGTQSATAMSAT